MVVPAICNILFQIRLRSYSKHHQRWHTESHNADLFNCNFIVLMSIYWWRMGSVQMCAYCDIVHPATADRAPTCSAGRKHTKSSVSHSISVLPKKVFWVPALSQLPLNPLNPVNLLNPLNHYFPRLEKVRNEEIWIVIHKFMLKVMPEIKPALLSMEIMTAFAFDPQCILA